MTEPSQTSREPTAQRLDLIRADVLLQMEIMASLLEIAHLYLSIDHDDDLPNVMRSLGDRFRAIGALLTKLQAERGDAELNGGAAEAWRQARTVRNEARGKTPHQQGAA